LCEDFEGTEVGDVPTAWAREDWGGIVEVSAEQAHAGVRALKSSASASGARRITISATGFGSAHWGRVFYRVELPVPEPFVHSTLVALQGDGPQIGGAEFRVVDTVKDASGDHQFLWNVQPSGGEFGKGSSYDWRFDDSWHCAEWHVDGVNQRYRFFIDAQEVTEIAIDNGAGNYGSGSDQTNIPEQFDELRLGWNNYQSAAPGFVAWFDDLAVSTEQIGCD
jgi:hypothetical protein